MNESCLAFETARMNMIATSIVGIISALAMLASVVVSHVLTKRREIGKIMAERELNRLMSVEESVGLMVECVLDYNFSAINLEEFQVLHKHVSEYTGRLLKYRDLSKSLRKLSHECGLMASYVADPELIMRQRPDGHRVSIQKYYDELIAEIDETKSSL